MPKGDKSKYTDKEKRQEQHIEKGYEDRGVSEEEAKRRAWATVAPPAPRVTGDTSVAAAAAPWAALYYWLATHGCCSDRIDVMRQPAT